jgi:RNA polymerase sigma-70 factor (ECF subfamily)
VDEREDELARLLEHARAEAPSAHVLTDVRERLLSSASDAVASSAGAAPTATPGAAVKLALPGKLAASALAIGAVIAAVYSASFDAKTPVPRAVPARVAPAAVQEPAPLSAHKPLEPAVIEPAPELVAPSVELRLDGKPLKRARIKVESAPVAPIEAAPTNPSFAQELGLIKAALEAQRAGRIDEARAKLEEHARRFPNGQLTHEREQIEARLSQ